jgi:hypothetical protein
MTVKKISVYNINKEDLIIIVKTKVSKYFVVVNDDEFTASGIDVRELPKLLLKDKKYDFDIVSDKEGKYLQITVETTSDRIYNYLVDSYQSNRETKTISIKLENYYSLIMNPEKYKHKPEVKVESEEEYSR